MATSYINTCSNNKCSNNMISYEIEDIIKNNQFKHNI